MSKGLIIAGTHSGVGKTTVTVGILDALKRKGLTVQSFKVGPDFIDAGLHELTTGRLSRNLDLWMCGKDFVLDCYRTHTAGSQIAIVEGVMGMFDGGAASTAEVAKTLGLPVMLVVDAHSMAESAAALVRGFEAFDASVDVAGVIFNRAGGERHVRILTDAMERYTGVKVLGHLPGNAEFSIPERHLGLFTKEEDPIPDNVMSSISKSVAENINTDLLLELARPLAGPQKITNRFSTHSSGTKTRIAVAKDRAFCFYYEDNLDMLRRAGCDVVPFSPLSDMELPEQVDAVYLGGGYPELYARALSGNKSMLKAVRKWAVSGKPLYAECGGLMYLSMGIYDFDGNFHGMAELFPFETAMKKGRANLGYREVRLLKDSIVGRKGDILRGHEFHYSKIKTEEPMAETAYEVNKYGGGRFSEGYCMKKTLASYVHIHFGSNPGIADSFVKFAAEA